MNRLFLSALLIFLATSTFAQISSQIEVTTKDGRTVILKPDGTWEFKKVVPQPSPTPVANSSKPIEATNSLPVNFAGQDASNLLVKLLDLKVRLTKNEFETTAQYEKRIAEEIQKPIIDNLTIKDTFSIVISRVETEYNADTQKMQFSLSVLESSSRKYGGVRDKKTAYDLKDVNLYSIIWSAGILETYGLFFDDLNNLALTEKGYYSKGFTAELSLDVEEAKRLKSTVKAAVLVKFEEPYAIDDGYGLVSKQFQTRLVDVYFFDPQTGKILVKMSEGKK